MDIYKGLPVEIRDKVKFMGKGGEARNGAIPASVAHSIIGLQRSFGFSQQVMTSLMKEINTEELNKGDLQTIGALIADGAKPLDAIKNRNKYKIFRLDITGENKSIKELARAAGTSPVKYLTGIIYGLYPSIDKPDFIK